MPWEGGAGKVSRWVALEMKPQLRVWGPVAEATLSLLTIPWPT